MGEDSVGRLPGSLLVHYMLEDFREDFQGSLPKLKSSKAWLNSGKKKLHIQKHLNDFKT